MPDSKISFRREPLASKSEQLLAAVRRGAGADEINELLAEIRCEQRLRRDAARVSVLAAHIARGEISPVCAEDLGQLLSLTRQALEVCA